VVELSSSRLYLDQPYRHEFEAEVLASADGWCAPSRTLFYPGGGGQPADRGYLLLRGDALLVSAVREDDGRIWHQVRRDLKAGEVVEGAIDWPFRYMLMRQHGLMHLVNTVMRERFGGVITGVQLGPDRSRIDFKLDGFTREQVAELEHDVNAVIQRGLRISSAIISEDEYRRRPELIRTLNVLPPIVDGRVRIVEIETFDTQACGGTHVHSTSEIGSAHVARFDNKGKDNKRFYWELTADPQTL